MSAWIPFFQTLAWVLLVMGILWRFSKEVRSLLSALRDRIERGSSVKAGPFELGTSAPAQNVEQQRSALNAEVRDATIADTDSDTVSKAPLRRGAWAPGTLGATVLMAEDLAMRQLQSEFGASISRQLRLGSEIRLDGMFMINGSKYGVEVKYIFRRLNLPTLETRLANILSCVHSYGWPRFVLILALVYGDESLLSDAERMRVTEGLKHLENTIPIRFYLFDELAQHFGLADG